MTLYPNFNPYSASEKIAENETTYIIQHGRRYRADPPYRFIGVEPSGMHPENSLLNALVGRVKRRKYRFGGRTAAPHPTYEGFHRGGAPAGLGWVHRFCQLDLRPDGLRGPPIDRMDKRTATDAR